MLTLNQAKIELGITLSDTGSDTELSRSIRQVIGRIRQQTMRGIAWVCDRVLSVNSEAQLRVIGHGWRTGQIVKCNGSTFAGLNAVHTITVIDRDTIEVNIDVAEDIENTEFTVHPKTVKDIVPTKPNRLWIPEQMTPCLSIVEIADNDGDNDWTALASDDWFANDVAGKKIVEVERIEGVFLVPIDVRRGQWGLRTRGAKETVRITVYEGSDVPPDAMVLAALSLVCDMYERAGRGKDEASFSFEDVRRQAMTGLERQEHVLSATSVINSWVAR